MYKTNIFMTITSVRLFVNQLINSGWMNELGKNDYCGFYRSFSFALPPSTAVGTKQQVVFFTQR